MGRAAPFAYTAAGRIAGPLTDSAPPCDAGEAARRATMDTSAAESCTWINPILDRVFRENAHHDFRAALSNLFRAELEGLRAVLLGNFMRYAVLRECAIGRRPPHVISVRRLPSRPCARKEGCTINQPATGAAQPGQPAPASCTRTEEAGAMDAPGLAEQPTVGGLIVELYYDGAMAVVIDVETVLGLVGSYFLRVSALKGQILLKLDATEPSRYTVAFIEEPSYRIEVVPMLGGRIIARQAPLIEKCIRSLFLNRYTLPNAVSWKVHLGDVALTQPIVEHLPDHIPHIAGQPVADIPEDRTDIHSWVPLSNNSGKTLCCLLCGGSISDLYCVCAYCSLQVHPRCSDTDANTRRCPAKFKALRAHMDGADQSTAPSGGCESSISAAPVPLLVLPAQDRSRFPHGTVPYVGRLVVRVLRATNLPSMDVINQSSDPFCVLSLGAQQRATRCIDRTLNPEWNECFQLDINLASADAANTANADEHDSTSSAQKSPPVLRHGGDDDNVVGHVGYLAAASWMQQKAIFSNVLRLTLFDQDRIKSNDFLGECVVYLADLMMDELHEKSYTLRARNDDAIVAHGSITLQLSLKLDVSRIGWQYEQLLAIQNRSSSLQTQFLTVDDMDYALPGSSDMVWIPPQSDRRESNSGSIFERRHSWIETAEAFFRAETAFVDDLAFGVAHYTDPLLQPEPRVLLEPQSVHLLEQYASIAAFVRNTYREPLALLRDADANIAQMNWLTPEYFDLYSNYCRAYADAVYVLQHTLAAQPDLRALCDRAREEPTGRGRPLGAFLLLPIERQRAYEQLLRDWLGNNRPTSPMYDLLHKKHVDLVKMQGQATSIVRSAQQLHAFQLLWHRMQPESRQTHAALLADGRDHYLLHRAVFTRAESKEPMALFLLNNALLLGKFLTVPVGAQQDAVQQLDRALADSADISDARDGPYLLQLARAWPLQPPLRVSCDSSSTEISILGEGDPAPCTLLAETRETASAWTALLGGQGARCQTQPHQGGLDAQRSDLLRPVPSPSNETHRTPKGDGPPSGRGLEQRSAGQQSVPALTVNRPDADALNVQSDNASEPGSISGASTPSVYSATSEKSSTPESIKEIEDSRNNLADELLEISLKLLQSQPRGQSVLKSGASNCDDPAGGSSSVDYDPDRASVQRQRLLARQTELCDLIERYTNDLVRLRHDRRASVNASPAPKPGEMADQAKFRANFNLSPDDAFLSAAWCHLRKNSCRFGLLYISKRSIYYKAKRLMRSTLKQVIAMSEIKELKCRHDTIVIGTAGGVQYEINSFASPLECAEIQAIATLALQPWRQ